MLFLFLLFWLSGQLIILESKLTHFDNFHNSIASIFIIIHRWIYWSKTEHKKMVSVHCSCYSDRHIYILMIAWRTTTAVDINFSRYCQSFQFIVHLKCNSNSLLLSIWVCFWFHSPRLCVSLCIAELEHLYVYECVYVFVCVSLKILRFSRSVFLHFFQWIYVQFRLLYRTEIKHTIAIVLRLYYAQVILREVFTLYSAIPNLSLSFHISPYTIENTINLGVSTNDL